MTFGRVDRFRGFVRGLLTQLVLVLVTLAAAELALRFADLRYLRDTAHPGHSFVFRYDPDLGWAPLPNAAANFAGLRTISVQNNSIGMRDIEPRRGAKPTILFLGDSFTWGFDVEAKDRFTDIRRSRMPRANIVNASVPGYGTDQEYLLLERLWNVVRPDVVVLIVCVDNDRLDNSSNVRYDGYYKPYLARMPDGHWVFRGRPVPKPHRAYFVDDWLVRNLWLARVAVSAYVQVRHRPISVPDPTDQLFRMMRDFVAARGGKFLVGLQRQEPESDAALKSLGVPHTAFDGAENFDDWGNHWTPEGHAHVADVLQSFLARNGIATAATASAAER